MKPVDPATSLHGNAANAREPISQKDSLGDTERKGEG